MLGPGRSGTATLEIPQLLGGEGGLDVPVQHHPASPRELAGLFTAQELSHAQIVWEQILWL